MRQDNILPGLKGLLLAVAEKTSFPAVAEKVPAN
jgi:hypothetical protein